MPCRLSIIAAVSPEGVIGVNNTLPWHYPADLKRFKRLTLGHTVIMGRHTWVSLPKKPLPQRRNIVLTRQKLAGVETFASFEVALASCEAEVWCIGGSRVFAEAMRWAGVIDLTYVPDQISDPDALFFPDIPKEIFQAGERLAHEDDPRLKHQRFTRRTSPPNPNGV